MEYRRLGGTGLKVSELCLGCMTFGRETDEKTAGKILDRFIEVGGNFLDTANVYAAGASEEILGRIVGERRKDLIVATKVRFNANIFMGKTGGSESNRPLARAYYVGGRGQPATAENGLHRSLPGALVGLRNAY